MKYKYVSHYALHLCLEYMKHDNIYDRFSYTWEENDNGYFITFLEYKDSMLSLKNSPKPFFKVVFEDLGNQTGINVYLLSDLLFVRTKDLDLFWKKKLDAEKI